MTTQLFVFSSALEGQDDAFNDWYDNTHLADVCALPGIVSAQRYEVANPEGVPAPKQRYLAVYECDGDPGEIVAAFGAGMADGSLPLTPTMDMASVQMTFWKPRG